MSTKTENGCLLIFRGNDWYKGLSPEQMQQIASEWKTWFDGLKREGKAVAGDPLENGGRVVIGKTVRNFADGPFAESKEAVGGYFLLTVDTLEEAVEAAKGCPGLPYGAVVEVRPIAANCPMAMESRPEALAASVA